MKAISINVPPKIADAFEKADEGSKRKAEIYINAWLTDFFGDKSANERLFNIMNQATAEAKANGFNEVEFHRLFNADE